jgi:hypothetical protein
MELENTEVGDQIIIDGEYVVVVTRTTKCVVFAGEFAFNRNGRERGAETWGNSHYAEAATQERIAAANKRHAEHETQKHSDRLTGKITSSLCSWATVNAMTVADKEAIVAILKKYQG